jgi:hypothetical protein
MRAISRHAQIFSQHAHHVPQSHLELLPYPFLGGLSSARRPWRRRRLPCAVVCCCERWTGPAGQGMVGEMLGGAGQFRLDEEELMPASVAMVDT